MDVGGKKLKVTKASIGITQIANFDAGIQAISGLASQTAQDLEASRILQLLNMTTAEELMDIDDYKGMPLHVSHDSADQSRNLRGRGRGVLQVRQSPRAQGPPAYWRQQAVIRRRQDLCQV